MAEDPKPLEGIILNPGEEGALVTIENRNPVEVFTDPGIMEAVLSLIDRQAMDFTPDLSTAKGRKEIASRAYRVAQTKALLDNIGKEQVAKMKELPKAIDAGRKTFRDRLDALKDRVRQPLTDQEARTAAIRGKLDEIKNAPAKFSAATSDAIFDEIARIHAVPTDESWGEIQEEAINVKGDILTAMDALLGAARKREAEAAELEELRRAKLAQDQKDREARIAQDAADKATREAQEHAQAEKDAALRREQDAELRARKAEQDKADSEKREAQTRADAEAREQRARDEERQKADKQAEAARKAQEAEAAEIERVRLAREADTEHQRKFNRESWADIQAAILADSKEDGTIEQISTVVLTAIVRNKVRHIKISYSE